MLLCAGIIGIIAVYSNTNYKSQNNRKPIFILKCVPGRQANATLGACDPFATTGANGPVATTGVSTEVPTRPTGKIVSFALSSLGGVLCLVAAAFLVLHVLLYIDRYAQCRDDPMRRQCLCALDGGAARFYRYDRVTCLQVHSTVKGLFYTMAAVSLLGGVCSLWHLTLLWSSRYVYFNAGLRCTLVDPPPGGLEQYSAAEAEQSDGPPRRLPQLIASPP
ncbi:uncharacterized protein [Dermacentor albipictus]|uniref:uncharacterized protein isoform X3 n=1 Tax=Dermacentor albipictus TaxID=60249 RepID=UPI0031FDB27A